MEVEVFASGSVLAIGSPPLRFCYLGSDCVHFASARGCVLYPEASVLPEAFLHPIVT